jgi:hypothetical protein
MFNEERDRWPEGPHLWMDQEDGIRLGIFLNGPHPEEIRGVDSGAVRYAWTECGANGLLLFNYGAAPWSEAPFNPQRLTEPFDLQPYERGTHRPVFTFMVHANTGRIAAMRLCTWPAYFLNHVIASVRRLAATPYSEPEAAAAQRDFYRRYPDGDAVGRLARTLPPEARCLGGQPDDQPQPTT